MTSSLAERLKIAMGGPPLVTAAHLARACGIKPPSVHAWVSGKTKSIEGSNLIKAAKALGVSADWLATGRGSMRALDANASKTSEPEPPPYYEQPQIQEGIALLRQLSRDQLNEAISFLRWQVANKAPPASGQAVSVA